MQHPSQAVLNGLERKSSRAHERLELATIAVTPQAKNASTERRRSRTDRAVGYTTALVLKTSTVNRASPHEL